MSPVKLLHRQRQHYQLRAQIDCQRSLAAPQSTNLSLCVARGSTVCGTRLYHVWHADLPWDCAVARGSTMDTTAPPAATTPHSSFDLHNHGIVLEALSGSYAKTFAVLDRVCVCVCVCVCVRGSLTLRTENLSRAGLLTL
jgi:hypothetical protein